MHGLTIFGKLKRLAVGSWEIVTRDRSREPEILVNESGPQGQCRAVIVSIDGSPVRNNQGTETFINETDTVRIWSAEDEAGSQELQVAENVSIQQLEDTLRSFQKDWHAKYIFVSFPDHTQQPPEGIVRQVDQLPLAIEYKEGTYQSIASLNQNPHLTSDSVVSLTAEERILVERAETDFKVKLLPGDIEKIKVRFNYLVSAWQDKNLPSIEQKKMALRSESPAMKYSLNENFNWFFFEFAARDIASERVLKDTFGFALNRIIKDQSQAINEFNQHLKDIGIEVSVLQMPLGVIGPVTQNLFDRPLAESIAVAAGIVLDGSHPFLVLDNIKDLGRSERGIQEMIRIFVHEQVHLGQVWNSEDIAILTERFGLSGARLSEMMEGFTEYIARDILKRGGVVVNETADSAYEYQVQFIRQAVTNLQLQGVPLDIIKKAIYINGISFGSQALNHPEGLLKLYDAHFGEDAFIKDYVNYLIERDGGIKAWAEKITFRIRYQWGRWTRERNVENLATPSSLTTFPTDFDSLYVKPGNKLNDNFYVISAVPVEGNYGTVYLAWDRANQRKVVIKINQPREWIIDLADRLNLLAIDTVRHEYRIMKDVESPYIAKTYGLYTTADDALIIPPGTSFLVQEFVEGEPLEDWLFAKMRDENPIEVRVAESIGILKQIALALDDFHTRKTSYNDLHSRNVYITNNKVKLIDFGRVHRPIFGLGMKNEVLSDIAQLTDLIEEVFRGMGIKEQYPLDLMAIHLAYLEKSDKNLSASGFINFIVEKLSELIKLHSEDQMTQSSSQICSTGSSLNSQALESNFVEPKRVNQRLLEQLQAIHSQLTTLWVETFTKPPESFIQTPEGSQCEVVKINTNENQIILEQQIQQALQQGKIIEIQSGKEGSIFLQPTQAGEVKLLKNQVTCH